MVSESSINTLECPEYACRQTITVTIIYTRYAHITLLPFSFASSVHKVLTN